MGETPRCPECRESVKEGATKCPHCASDLPSKTAGYGYILIGILILPVSGIFLYLTSSAVNIGRTFFLVYNPFEMIIWGGVIGVLLSIGLAGPFLILKGIEQISQHKEMRSPPAVSEPEGSAVEEFKKGYKENKSKRSAAEEFKKSYKESKQKRDEELNQITKKTERWVERINNSAERFVSSFTDPNITVLNWLRPLGVVLGSLLWISIWFLLGNQTAFGIALFSGWLILPISLFLDIRTVNRRGEITFRWWAYVLPSLIPFIPPLFGLLWLLRRKQKTKL